MDRKHLVELFRKGMQYPPGRHRFWFSRCFEITVHPDEVVELDEYESFSADKSAAQRTDLEMFHVGRSVLHLKEGKLIEHRGDGWKKPAEKNLDKRKRR